MPAAALLSQLRLRTLPDAWDAAALGLDGGGDAAAAADLGGDGVAVDFDEADGVAAGEAVAVAGQGVGGQAEVVQGVGV